MEHEYGAGYEISISCILFSQFLPLLLPFLPDPSYSPSLILHKSEFFFQFLSLLI